MAQDPTQKPHRPPEPRPELAPDETLDEAPDETPFQPHTSPGLLADDQAEPRTETDPGYEALQHDEPSAETLETLPRSFGRYQLEETLGEGGMGRVYRATLQGHAGFRKSLALKVISADQASGSDYYTQAFQREARIGGLLSHPNLVDVLDFGLHEDTPYMVMELLAGWSLSELMKTRGPLPISASLDLTIQLTRGLIHAHELELDGEELRPVHRDLKPANIWVTDHGRAKILDFGICRTVQTTDDLTEVGRLRGTPRYMSPEQAMGADDLDARSDLFSLGVILYELIVGEHPWAAPSLLAQLRALYEVDTHTGSQEFWSTLRRDAPALHAPLVRCLRRDRIQRPADARALLGDLLDARESGLAGPSLRDWLEGWSEAGPATVRRPRGPESRPPLESGFAEDRTENPVGEPTEFPPTARHNLPEDLDSFIGRQEALGTLQKYIDGGQRLISLVGTGGTGKTRLSRQFARTQMDAFPGGVWFCDLTEARTREGIEAAVAQALGVPLTQPDVPEQLAHAIEGRGRTLLLLDNFEKLVDLAPETLGRWLEQAPQAYFLVTSRVLLRIRGEAVLDLQPFLPSEALKLFYDRASAAQLNFVRTESNAPVVLEIVERLDGLALAVEMAASRVRMMSPQQILNRLDQRFQLLRDQRLDSSDRHLSLRASLDDSWGLLSPSDGSTLAQLSVFRGGWTLEDAEAVVDLGSFDEEPWVMETLQNLVDHCLVHQVAYANGAVSFKLLESVREYATEKLGSGGAETGARHARYFSVFGSRTFLDSLASHGGAARRRRLNSNLQNLVIGFERAYESHEYETALLCAIGASEVFVQQGPIPEGLTLFARLDPNALGHDLQIQWAFQRGRLFEFDGDVTSALGLYERALPIAVEEEDRVHMGLILLGMGDVHRVQGRAAEAEAAYKEAMAITTETGQRALMGEAMARLGLLKMNQDNPKNAQALYESGLSIARELGDRQNASVVLGNLGLLFVRLRHPRRAQDHFEEALAIHREDGNRYGEGVVLTNLGNSCWEQEAFAEARCYFDRALSVVRETGNRIGEGVILAHLGKILHRGGDLELAEGHLNRAIEISDRAFPAGAAVARLELAKICLQRGDTSQARSLLDRGASQLRGGFPLELASLLCVRTRTEILANDLDAATAALAEAELITGEAELDSSAKVRQVIVQLRKQLKELGANP